MRRAYPPRSFKEPAMPDTKSKSNATLVMGAGELGMPMLHALNAQRTARDGAVSVLLRPTGSACVATAQQGTLDALRDMGVDVVKRPPEA
jgi:hypothetical protein